MFAAVRTEEIALRNTFCPDYYNYPQLLFGIWILQTPLCGHLTGAKG